MKFCLAFLNLNAEHSFLHVRHLSSAIKYITTVIYYKAYSIITFACEKVSCGVLYFIIILLY